MKFKRQPNAFGDWEWRTKGPKVQWCILICPPIPGADLGNPRGIWEGQFIRREYLVDHSDTGMVCKTPWLVESLEPPVVLLDETAAMLFTSRLFAWMGDVDDKSSVTEVQRHWRAFLRDIQPKMASVFGMTDLY